MAGKSETKVVCPLCVQWRCAPNWWRNDVADDFMAEFDALRWEVTTYPVGNTVHVSPGKGLLGMENWTYRWRRMYPRTERQLERAVAACQRFCDKQNAKEARGRALAERVKG